MLDDRVRIPVTVRSFDMSAVLGTGIEFIHTVDGSDASAGRPTREQRDGRVVVGA